MVFDYDIRDDFIFFCLLSLSSYFSKNEHI